MGRDNVILIGMPAAGKSTVGVILAKVLGYDFLDTDLLLQRRAGGRLEELLRARGQQGFLALEAEVLNSLDMRRTVIATGGSAVYSDAAMAHLRSLGRIVYLEVPLKTLQTRLEDLTRRGVVLRPGQTLEDLYRERTELYCRYAELTVHEGGRTLEATVDAVCRALAENEEG